MGELTLFERVKIWIRQRICRHNKFNAFNATSEGVLVQCPTCRYTIFAEYEVYEDSPTNPKEE